MNLIKFLGDIAEVALGPPILSSLYLIERNGLHQEFRVNI